MERNSRRALQWMLRQRYGGTGARSDRVGFPRDGTEVIKFEVQEPESVEHEVDADVNLVDETDRIAVCRFALKVRITMARKHLDHIDSGRLAFARAKLLQKSLDNDDETHLGFVGLGILEGKMPIEKVKLAADHKKMPAAKRKVKDADQSSMRLKFAGKASAAQARLGSILRSVKSASSPRSSSGGVAGSASSQRTGWSQADVHVRSGFWRRSSRKQARVNPSFDSVGPHPDARSSDVSRPGPGHRP
eukprot:TRINITY_DN15523_c0_g1_i1.p1 TRINITY_DN15523_c0_g1~~TRINITY_DN15523_c0_g1_i1.p1  ORF type:complete len:247 (+),score=22.25 TRINITY_DN15523_c0_g1_i1:51-791(+)